jgi:hypothetical protein
MTTRHNLVVGTTVLAASAITRAKWKHAASPPPFIASPIAVLAEAFTSITL